MSKKVITLENLAEFKLKCDETYSSSPIFDAELTENEGHEGEIEVEMSEADRNDIYEHKYPVICLRIPDEENEGEYNYMYFKSALFNEHSEAVIYEYWIADDDNSTISKLELTFLWDGDEAKVIFEEIVFSSGGGTKLYKHSLIINYQASDSAYIVLVSQISEAIINNGQFVTNNLFSKGEYWIEDVSWYSGTGNKILKIKSLENPAYPSQKSVKVYYIDGSDGQLKLGEFAPSTLTETIIEL